MDNRYVRGIRVAAAVLVFVTAAFHLWWGLPRALVYGRALGTFFSRGLPPDPRPFLFVAFSFALLAGPYLVTREVISVRRAYQLGVLAMVLSFLGWVFWHQTGHGAFLAGVTAPSETGHSHDVGLLTTIVRHFVLEPAEGLIKSAELLAAGLFAFLLRVDPAAEAGR